jgi:hypothetical protein
MQLPSTSSRPTTASTSRSTTYSFSLGPESGITSERANRTLRGDLGFRGTASFSHAGGVVTGSDGVSGVDVGSDGVGLVGARVTRSDETRIVSSPIQSRRVVPAFSTTRYGP